MSYFDTDDFHFDFGDPEDHNVGQYDDWMEPFTTILTCPDCGKVRDVTVTHPSDEFYCCGRRLCG